MSRFWKGSVIALLAFLTFVPAASAREAFFGGPHAFGIYYGPGFYPGFYGPGWWYGYGPWWGPAYVSGPPVGEVKILTKHKGDSIYIDGGFAGRTGQLKKFPLRAGTHTLELRKPGGRAFYQERIAVIPGRTLKIHTDYPGQPGQAP
ncbi:MAG: PEGA domain-containing protein [Terriglobia bacterium]|jgi:hypothetical protein